jgi:hypothetical protein
MKVLIALLYLVAVILVIAAGFRPTLRYSLALFGGGLALLAFAIPSIQAGFSG